MSPFIHEERGVGWAKYLWLCYLLFYFVYLVMLPATTAAWVISILAVAIFLPLYLYGFRITGTRLIVVTLAIYALGSLTMPWNPGANCFFIYAAAFIGFAGTPRLAAWWLITLLAGIVLQAWIFHWPAYISIPTFIVAGVVGATNINVAEYRRRGAELRVAREAVVEMARVAERERIGRDLHDLLGHTLSVIVLKSELASKLAEREPARAASEIRDVEQISRHALTEVRKAVRGYRSEGLSDAIGNAERVLVSAGIRPHIDCAPLVLEPDEERALAFSLREAVTNVIRHAQAQHCWITLTAATGRAVLEVRDDGRGGNAPEGSGLSGMRERLRQVAGTVERSGDGGTRLLITLPRGRTATGFAS
jgi:two-component system, NarL family, sensor histidine kinase DesK